MAGLVFIFFEIAFKTTLSSTNPLSKSSPQLFEKISISSMLTASLKVLSTGLLNTFKATKSTFGAIPMIPFWLWEAAINPAIAVP